MMLERAEYWGPVCRPAREFPQRVLCHGNHLPAASVIASPTRALATNAPRVLPTANAP